MEKITELLNSLEDLGKLIPDLSKVTGWVQWLISLAVRVGPVCILLLGLIYLLIPPKGANRKAGYRTYFGMGSVKAWRWTQLIAGVIMTVTGLILTLIAYKAVGKFGEMDLMAMGEKAFSLIKTQVICALVIYVFMFLLTAVLFDRKGERRFGKKFYPAVREPVRPEAVEESSAEALPAAEVPAEEPVVVYEKQGEQVITADDIVIEGLD